MTKPMTNAERKRKHDRLHSDQGHVKLNDWMTRQEREIIKKFLLDMRESGLNVVKRRHQ